ncbi:hypothetical protein MMC07_004275 [Pseudocyphellaria aurata]|nr:hypothetical protein [Pseudocyphellaria aurata]
MSFGISPTDIATAISIVHKVYKTYKKSPDDYKLFSWEVEQVQETYKLAQEMCQDTHWSKGQQERFKSITSHLAALSQDLSTFVRKYGSLENGKGRRWDRVRYSLEEVENFRKQIMRSNFALLSFLNLIRNSHCRESNLREGYEPSLASDQQTLTPSTVQSACDQPHESKSSFFDKLGSHGSSLDAAFGGNPLKPSIKKPVGGVDTCSIARRTRSAEEAEQPKPRAPKKNRSLSSTFGSSSPSMAQVRSPFGPGHGPTNPS